MYIDDIDRILSIVEVLKLTSIICLHCMSLQPITLVIRESKRSEGKAVHFKHEGILFISIFIVYLLYIP